MDTFGTLLIIHVIKLAVVTRAIIFLGSTMFASGAAMEFATPSDTSTALTAAASWTISAAAGISPRLSLTCSATALT
jgi:hypothetical protein